ncbi:MAG: HAMP domain-containing protein [Gammaproteobacteria bacterium]|nr:HAMP domain-containing protein [Gammaproteobacteria bacterium]
MKRAGQSFRLRMFLATALIVAAVLVSVAAVSGSTFYSYEVRHLDSRLCDEGWRLASRPPRVEEVEAFASDVAGKLRLHSADQLLLARNGRDGSGAVRFGRWPDGLSPDGLAWSAAGVRRECRIAEFESGGRGWRMASVTAADAQAFVAADQAAVRSDIWAALKRIATVAGPIALVLTGLGAWFLSGLALRPVNRVREAMKSVDERALDRRLSSEREAREFRDLIQSYNDMLERLEASFNQASRFSADAAHELKTPLTILRGQLEQAIPLADGHPLQQNLVDMLDEVGRLASIARKLLLLSQSDAGRLALLRTAVDVGAMLRDRIADARMLALDASIAMDVAGDLRLQADEQLLGQVLNNLLSNAIRYTPPGGRISVRAQASASGVEVLFTNTTRPIAQDERARFFERFYRGDPARSRALDGHGLGLSLSRVIARAHGGDLTLEPSEATQVVLRLTLPVGDRGSP